ncbi:MAG: hypothetical protein ACI4C1_00790 [Lachnospiraceae bacterium]
MRWSEQLVVGSSAKPKIASIKVKLKYHMRQDDLYVITTSRGKNLMDIVPDELMHVNYMRQSDYMILGIALGKSEAYEVARQIVERMYLDGTLLKPEERV